MGSAVNFAGGAKAKEEAIQPRPIPGLNCRKALPQRPIYLKKD
jgi:hypothetical protein